MLEKPDDGTRLRLKSRSLELTLEVFDSTGEAIAEHAEIYKAPLT